MAKALDRVNLTHDQKMEIDRRVRFVLQTERHESIMDSALRALAESCGGRREQAARIIIGDPWRDMERASRLAGPQRVAS